MLSTPYIKLNIGRKLLIITILSLAGMIFTLFLFYQGLASSLKQEKVNQTQSLSDAGMNIVKHFHRLVSKNKLEKQLAQKMVLDVLEASKFGERGYFWVNNAEGKLLMHPYTNELVDTNVMDLVDIQGNYLFRSFIETAKDGGGLVEYYWPKPEGTEPFPKKSYVVYFEPWDWVLGTGLYLDDMQRDIRKYAISALSVVFVFTTLLIIFSITWTKKIMHHLESLAIRDPLTSLYTRRFLNDQMENLILKHERDKDKYLSVVFFDIDFFKDVNDTYGHSCGDEVLSKIGYIIKSSSRPDDLCIRYGGEEFVVILLSTKKKTALKYAERVLSISNKILFKGNETDFSITLSAGVAISEKNESFYLTLQRADQKLYKAKAQGRNCVVS